MANSLVQFRTDETLKIKAANICERLGIDLPTYMRMCISRLIQENGVPFSMKLEKEPESLGVMAMKAASRIAEENGIQVRCDLQDESLCGYPKPLYMDLDIRRLKALEWNAVRGGGGGRKLKYKNIITGLYKEKSKNFK